MIANTSLSRLQTFYGHLDALDLLRVMIREEFINRIGMVSSFGSGSAILLALVAEINNNIPILFLQTGKHFSETLQYLEDLKKQLNLTNVKLLTPREDLINNIDKDGNLWNSNPNRCCWMRKVEPLKTELDKNYLDALITGRKKYQTIERHEMQTIELAEDGRFRINPLANWDKQRIKEEFGKRGLKEHPLVAKGYLSIGCEPCTRPVKQGEDERAGRWAHTAELPGGERKNECGIHLSEAALQKPDWNI